MRDLFLVQVFFMPAKNTSKNREHFLNIDPKTENSH